MGDIKITLEEEGGIIGVLHTKAIVDVLKSINTTLRWIALWAFVIAYEMCSGVIQ